MAGALWIESHADLREHPKLARLVRALKCSRIEAIGHLHCLWWWAARYADDGQISDWTAADLADGAEWLGDPQAFIEALRFAGFLEEDGNLHDWNDYFKLLSRRKTDRERKQNSSGIPVEFHRKVSHSSGIPSLPDLTRPNQTVPDQTGNNVGDSPTPPCADAQVVRDVLDDLNALTGKDYRPTTKAYAALIRARIAEGATLDDFKTVHKNMVAKWSNDPKMVRYLRPQTLYQASKFESYRNETVTAVDAGAQSGPSAVTANNLARLIARKKLTDGKTRDGG